MSFYCVYCNRVRSGKKDSPEERTKEHFIPQSIGGRWKIPICKECNEHTGNTCDAFFAQVSYTYQIFRQNIAQVKGLAKLLDGRIVPAKFKYQAAESHYQLHWCYDLTSQTSIPQSEIEALRFKAQDPSDVIATHPAVAKMALGSVYYLVRRYKGWSSATEALFSGLTFFNLRRLFLPKPTPGGIGQYPSVTIRSLLSPEAETLLRSRRDLTRRRHYISIEDSNSSLLITLCLYSTYFWRTTVYNAALGVISIEDEIILRDLLPVDDITKAANLMHHDGNAWIEIRVPHK
jgi:hypothetical protein